MKFITILCLTATFATSSYAQNWITNPANGHRYAEITNFTHWVGAEAIAVSWGGHLATIRNSAENEWIRTTFELNGGTNEWCWIGLYEVDFKQRTWAWISGEPVTYTNWGAGEPSGPGAEHWVAMDGDGWWRDLASDWPPPMRHIAVAEVVPEPTTIAVLGFGLLAIARRRK